MKAERKTFAAGPGSKAGVLSSEERADALEETMMKRLHQPAAPAPKLRRGTGVLFGCFTPGCLPRELGTLDAMPPRLPIVDFFKLRFMPHTPTHLLQSAN